MSHNWNDIEVFCTVAELGSFTRAAERLQLPKSTVSRAVSAFENHLGIRLLERSTRSLRLTEAGRELHEQIGPMFERLSGIVEDLQTRRDQPRGVLRISTPFEFGVLQLNSVICELLAKHPGLEAEIEMSTSPRNPVAEDFDLVFSLREGPPPDSSLVARQVFTVNTVLCAAPALVAKLGMPKHPRDLAAWPCLTDDADTVWRFSERQGGDLHELRVDGRLRTGNTSLRMGAAEAGIGAAILSDILCREALELGKLVRLLPAWQTPPRLVYAFMPARRLVPARVRAFLAALSAMERRNRQQPRRYSPLRGD